MNQDSLTFALTQIGYLVSNLNKRNFSQNVRLINKVRRRRRRRATFILYSSSFQRLGFFFVWLAQ